MPTPSASRRAVLKSGAAVAAAGPFAALVAGSAAGSAFAAPVAGAGTTTIHVTKKGDVIKSFTSLNGTLFNCSGGQMPWGSWITCEETVNGPDVGPDFTGVSNVPLTQPHGFVFEVPVDGVSNGEPITAAGRFA